MLIKILVAHLWVVLKLEPSKNDENRVFQLNEVDLPSKNFKISTFETVLTDFDLQKQVSE